MFCKNCNNEIDDNAFICPHCGEKTDNYAPQGAENAQPNQGQYYQPNQQGQYYQQPQQQQYQGQYYQQPQQPQYQGQYYQQPNQQNQYYQQPVYGNQYYIPNKPNTVVLGVLSIVLGLFIPLAGWILGGIGLGKSNAALKYYPQDAELLKGKKLNIAGLIVTSVVFALSFLLLFISILGTSSLY